MERQLIDVGSIVKWYDYYADRIVRDAGLGIVMDHEKTRIFNGKMITVYYIFRFAPHLDWCHFTGDSIDLYREEKT